MRCRLPIKKSPLADVVRGKLGFQKEPLLLKEKALDQPHLAKPPQSLARVLLEGLSVFLLCLLVRLLAVGLALWALHSLDPQRPFFPLPGLLLVQSQAG